MARRAAQHALVALFWVGVWALGAAAVGKPLLLPGPLDTLRALIRLAQGAAFWQSTGMTLLRVAAGFLSAVFLGAALGALCYAMPLAETLLSPLRGVIRATPVSSFIILVLLWIQRGRVPAFISFLMVLPIVWTGVQQGLHATDPLLLEMARAYRFSRWKKLRYLYAPSVRPYFAAACMTGLGFAWTSGIAAEVIALPALSVGKNLYDAKIYLERADLFAWTLAVILLSLGLEALLKRAIGRVRG